MLLRPLVEHVIRRVMAGFEDGRTISIAGCIEDGKLCFRVADNAHGGTGLDLAQPHARVSSDLDSMRERLNVIFGSEHECRLERL